MDAKEIIHTTRNQSRISDTTEEHHDYTIHKSSATGVLFDLQCPVWVQNCAVLVTDVVWLGMVCGFAVWCSVWCGVVQWCGMRCGVVCDMWCGIHELWIISTNGDSPYYAHLKTVGLTTLHKRRLSPFSLHGNES